MPSPYFKLHRIPDVDGSLAGGFVRERWIDLQATVAPAAGSGSGMGMVIFFACLGAIAATMGAAFAASGLIRWIALIIAGSLIVLGVLNLLGWSSKLFNAFQRGLDRKDGCHGLVRRTKADEGYVPLRRGIRCRQHRLHRDRSDSIRGLSWKHGVQLRASRAGGIDPRFVAIDGIHRVNGWVRQRGIRNADKQAHQHNQTRRRMDDDLCWDRPDSLSQTTGHHTIGLRILTSQWESPPCHINDSIRLEAPILNLP